MTAWARSAERKCIPSLVPWPALTLSNPNLARAPAGRLSYTFAFKGPAVSVDTACSSSLVASHIAASNVWGGAGCTAALAAGVGLLLSPDTTSMFHKVGARELLFAAHILPTFGLACCMKASGMMHEDMIPTHCMYAC